MDNLSVLIVEDHVLLSDAWTVIFRTKTSFNVIGTAASQAAAEQLVRDTQPDIILLDINLGEVSGLDLIPVFRKESPRSRIIMITVSAIPLLAKKAIRAGAKGYITKNEDFEVLLQAINAIINGGVFISTAAIEPAGQSGEAAAELTSALLSKKEKIVTRYICEGLTTKEIARKIKLSASTIETHRHNILKKLKLKNVAELTNLFLYKLSDRKGI